MKPFKHNKRTILSLTAFILLIGCNTDEDPKIYNSSLVFPTALEVQIDPYEYTDTQSSKLIHVEGDTLVDTLSSTPELRWKSFASEIYTVAISTVEMHYQNGSISNPDDIIWQWHSGMESNLSDVGDYQYISVLFNKGKPVDKKNILYYTQPLPLESGLYFWAIWGWDKSGRRIAFSSKPLKFVVE